MVHNDQLEGQAKFAAAVHEFVAEATSGAPDAAH